MGECELTERIEKAMTLCEQGCSCAQSVAAVFDDNGLDRATMLKLSSGFGGGIAQSYASTCGGLISAIMVLGLIIYDAEDPESSKNVQAKAQKLLEEFIDRHQSSVCIQLIQQKDLQDRTSSDIRLKNCEYKHPCGCCIADCIELLEEHLIESDFDSQEIETS